MALHLYFDLAAVLELAEHAAASSDHNPSFTEHTDQVPCPGALVWVHDQGVYLISSGLPHLQDPNRPDSSRVVYAEGWNPDTDGYRHDPNLGGDDFAEHLHLTEQPEPLLDALRAAHTTGYRWLHLTVHPNTYEVGVTRTRRPA